MQEKHWTLEQMWKSQMKMLWCKVISIWKHKKNNSKISMSFLSRILLSDWKWLYGKMLVLTFEDNEDDMMSRILSLINTKEEVIQMSGLNNHLLNFKGLMIDEVQRVIIRENQEIELTYTEFEILKLLAKHPGIVFSKEQIYDIVLKESYSDDYNIVMTISRWFTVFLIISRTMGRYRSIIWILIGVEKNYNVKKLNTKISFHFWCRD